jgi:hypothetical protein
MSKDRHLGGFSGIQGGLDHVLIRLHESGAHDACENSGIDRWETGLEIVYKRKELAARDVISAR